MITEFKTLKAPATAEFKDKGSRFLAFAYPLAQAEALKDYVLPLQKEHHKAVHFCYAYRIGTDGTQFRANDDGEPAGSAGRPILGQIDSAGLSNVLVIVVRYFGGTLLGVPGLIHAYKTATALALANAEIIEETVEQSLAVLCAYADMSEVLRVVKQHQGRVVQQQLALDCRLDLSIPLAHYSACLKQLETLRQITVWVLEQAPL